MVSLRRISPFKVNEKKKLEPPPRRGNHTNDDDDDGRTVDLFFEFFRSTNDSSLPYSYSSTLRLFLDVCFTNTRKLHKIMYIKSTNAE